MAQINGPQKKDQGDPMGRALQMMQMAQTVSSFGGKGGAETSESAEPSNVSGTNAKAEDSQETAMSRAYRKKSGGYV